MQRDWMEPKAYADMREYDAEEFAAEYLIRNHDFIAECSQLALPVSGTGQLAGPAEFAARWGARFRGHQWRPPVGREHRLD